MYISNKFLVILLLSIAIVAIASFIIYTLAIPKMIRIRVTTTTSLYATGLLEYLAQQFYKDHPNVKIDFIAVGSGEALRRAERGDACMVFVHAPSLEKKYIDRGILEKHRIIAYNYFIIVGPADDPAHIKNSTNAVEAFSRIYRAGEEGKAVFVSRGDNSGTHVKELSIWRTAGLDPHGRPWYRESGSGMAQTLVIANEMNAYTLSDIGTYLKLKVDRKIPNLEILYSNSTELINIYSIYIVSSCKGNERKYAEEFSRFVYEHQELISDYGVDRYGQPLFYAAKDREDELYKIWQELAKG
ncbi:MAG TPA: extracellular solute-binding protein [Ignisphaera sp.]|nr:extracellular solute-binding protein [Ignisphaera sp.]